MSEPIIKQPDSSNPQKAENTSKTEQSKSSGLEKLAIAWELKSVAVNPLNGKSYGAVGNGSVTYKGRTFVGTSSIPRSVAEAKAEIAKDITEQIKAAGLDKEITVGLAGKGRFGEGSYGGGGATSRWE